MADVKISFVGDDASLVQRIEKQQAAIGKLTEKLRQMKTQGRQATKDVGGGLADGARQALAFAGALTGVGTAAGAIMGVVRQIKSEIEALRAYQTQAAQTTMTLGEARNNALLNKPPDMSPAAMDAMVKRIAQESNLTQTAVYGMAGSPMSARGALSSEAFQANVAIGARLSAQLGQGFDANSFTGALLDISRFTGTAGMRTFGWLRQGAIASRVTDPTRYAKNLVRVMGTAAPLKVPAEEAAEVFATATQLLGDPTGDIAKTASATLISGAYKDVLPGPWKPNAKGRMQPTWTVPTGTLPERLAQMRQAYAEADREMREKMLTQIGGGVEGAGLIRGMLAGTPEALREYAAARQAIGSPTAPGLRGTGEELFQWFQQSPGSAARDVVLAGDRANEALTMDEVAAVAAKLREQQDKLLRNLPGLGDLDRKLLTAQYEIGTGYGTRHALRGGVELIDELLSSGKWSRRYRVDYGSRKDYVDELSERSRLNRFLYPGEENPYYSPRAVDALTSWRNDVQRVLNKMEQGLNVAVVDDRRAKQYGGASPHGE